MKVRRILRLDKETMLIGDDIVTAEMASVNKEVHLLMHAKDVATPFSCGVACAAGFCFPAGCFPSLHGKKSAVRNVCTTLWLGHYK